MNPCELADKLESFGKSGVVVEQAVLLEAAAQLRRVESAVATFGYEDGSPVQNILRYHKYTTGEIERLRNGSAKLQAYALKLQELLKPEQVKPIAIELMIDTLREDNENRERERERGSGH